MKHSTFAKTLATGLILLCTVPQEGHAQERYAAFIHGITFGDSRPEGVRDGERCWPNYSSEIYDDRPFLQEACNDEWEDAGSRWQASGVPKAWNGGVIDGHTFLRYFDRDLYGGSRDVTVDWDRESMMRRFVRQMKAIAGDAEWVLVGHSQGGIVARLLHEYIRRNNIDLEVEGVLAIASPMQGARVANVSYGDRGSYYKNIKPTLDGLFKDLLDGPVNEAGEYLDRTIALPGLPVWEIANWFWEPTDTGIDIAEGVLKDKINSMAVRKNARTEIGPNGDIIRKINSAPNPDNYRALLGAERAPVVFRVFSAWTTSDNPVAPAEIDRGFIPPTDLAELVTKDGLKFSAGEEPKLVEAFQEFLSTYRSKEEKWEPTFCFIGCIGGDRRIAKGYRQGRRALENIGKTTTKLLNAYRTDRRTRTMLDCERRFEPAGSQFAVPSVRQHIDSRPIVPGDCRRIEETYYVTVPDKTDGLLGTNTTTWHPPSSRGTGPNLGPHSLLYNDRPSSNQYKQGGTGYNHAEMVYNRRRYNSAADPGIGGNDPSFSEGQRNPPMLNAEDWIEDAYGGPN
jgi:pimeloyl-ACP methyl ester carboxylesterase